MWKIKFIFQWWDFWVGLFIDRKKRRLYILPLPCLGVVIEVASKCSDCDKIIFTDNTYDYCGRPHCCTCSCANDDFDREFS
ncbi:hypothetical protein LCGC14_1957510 [marine sediment metagenome]|uniref:Uncharacterized protein n=1 Tax=marine sediment metagenome TaxID=412755 RepID=A0A0F9ICP0_9ZZZZ